MEIASINAQQFHVAETRILEGRIVWLCCNILAWTQPTLFITTSPNDLRKNFTPIWT